MKKMLMIITAIAVLVGYSAVVKAEDVSSTVPLSFTVPAAFGFTLDKYSHNFGTVNAGSGAETTLSISCRSNHGKVWKLSLKADPFTSGATTMASDPAFKFAPWSNAGDEQAKGTFVPAPGGSGAVVPAVATDFYTSTLGEGSDPYIPLVLGLYLTVPTTQASGLYNTNLVLTMYE
ncbi:MAG: hypothetical protein PHI59_03805 [Candidatus Omnitrophica bacterium]|nr:hypothetical protein [Candidatus Omnitrophota bacterium]